jgi:hypothetical protein
MRLEDAIDTLSTTLQDNGYDDTPNDIFEAIMNNLEDQLNEI